MNPSENEQNINQKENVKSSRGKITSSMLKKLKEGSIVEQLIVIQKMGEMKSETIIHPLLDVVRSGKSEIIEEVAQVIVKNESIFKDFIPAELLNNNCFIRWTIALAVQKLEKKAYLPFLIPALGMGYEPVIKILTKTLHQLDPNKHPKDDFQYIITHLSEDEKHQVLLYAIKQLGEDAYDTTETLFALNTLRLLKKTQSIVSILKSLQHQDYRVRERAEKILDDVFSHKEFYDACKSHIVHKHEFNELYDFRLEGVKHKPLHIYAIEGLKRNLGKGLFKKQKKLVNQCIESESLNDQLAAIKTLIQIQKSHNPHYEMSYDLKFQIKNILKDLEKKERLRFIEELAKIGMKWAGEAILAYLDDDRPEVRLAVIRALNQTKIDAKSILEKAAILLVDENKNVRKSTLELFWRLKPNVFGLNEGDILNTMPEKLRIQLLDLMVDGLENGDEEYRKFAGFWLGALQYKPAYDALCKNLYYPSEDLKIKIIRALGLFGDKRAVKPLLKLIDEEEGDIQRKAIQTIGSLGIEGVFELIHKLYQKKGATYSHPEFLEKYLLSFGGKIRSYLEKELIKEKDAKRKKFLEELYNKISKDYSIDISDDFKIYL